MKVIMPKPVLFLLLTFLFACQSTATSTPPPTSAPEKVKRPAPIKDDPKANIELSLAHQIHEPAEGSKDAPLLILLHGRGSNEGNFISMAPNLDPKLRVVSVRGPLILRPGSFAWFDLQRGQNGLRKYEENEVLAMSDQLIDFIEELISKYGLEPSKIFIGGFSQGAIMSLGTGLRHPGVIDGVLCLSGALYPEFMKDFKLKKEHEELSILVTHGRKDNVLSFDHINEAVDLLKQKGLDVSFKHYDSAHTFPPENFRDFRDWLVSELDN